MSGGFFRGTSADQDTRFSNKQAKLLKSQKFAPELEHLVDVRKVKMDVVRPWIATRVTELLGFEDEVLINFIYGLLDGKEVNGKEVQISLTGFMEKNTGKFMKELWGLLLSAQSNESGVPQQFLDAKEEETRKKQAEVDRITSEIKKKKEKEGGDIGGERSKKMDGRADTRNDDAAMAHVSKDATSRGASFHLGEDREPEKRNGVRGRSRFSRSPRLADRSSLSPRDSPPRGRKSLSNSRSYSGDRRKSRSRTRSPGVRGRSLSSERGYHQSRKRSISPRKRSPRNSPSPPRRSSYSRQRSRSPTRRRSPSPMPRRRLHSPYRRRSPSPIRRRRSPSPIRHRRSPSPIRRRRSPSPIRRRRSPSPIRRRRSPSPIRRRRSPSPIRRRRSPSPIRRRRPPSPVRRRRSPLPIRGRSRSPIRRASSSPRSSRSPIPAKRRSPSPLRHRHQRSPSTPVRRRSPSPRHRSPSPYGSSSPSPVQNKSLLPAAMHKRSSTPPHQKSPFLGESRSPSPARRRSFSPVRKGSPKELKRSPVDRERLRAVDEFPPKSLTPPHRDSEKQKNFHDKSPSFSPSPKRSPIRSESPALTRKKTVGQSRRSSSPYESPVSKRTGAATSSVGRSPGKQREQRPHHLSPDSSHESEENAHARSSKKRSGHAYSAHELKDSPVKHEKRNGYSPGSNKRETSRKKDHESIRSSVRNDYPENSDEQGSPTFVKDGKKQSVAGERHKSDDRNPLHSNDVKDNAGKNKFKTTPILEKADHDRGGKTCDSGSEESDKRRAEKKERRKNKRSHKQEEVSDNAGSYDSEIDERKNAKRRRKEERKLRKEEKRRRREERRRRKEEQSAEKRKLKDRRYTDSSEDIHDGRDSYRSDVEETQSQQKRLEIELRNKALESLKAKKGIDH